MDFEKVQDESLIEEYRHHYLNYRELTRVLENSSSPDSQRGIALNAVTSGSGTGNAASGAFMSLLDAQLAKVNSICDAKYRELELALAHLSRSVFEDGAELKISEFNRLANNLARRIVDLDAFAKQNISGFKQILAKHDYQTGMSVRPWFTGRLQRETCANLRVDSLIVALSDIYSRMRALADGNGEAGQWKPPDSFERNTTKYWVKPSDVVRIKTHIVKHLPVLIFNRESGKTSTATPDIRRLEDAADITSIYMDNEDLDCYHTRSERLEGATLTRWRWYGSRQEEVFLERKTHHESWVVEGSVKERFNVKAKQVLTFMNGEFDAEKQAGKMKKKGAPDTEIEKMKELAKEINEDVQTRRLEPKVRTVYKRTAFQLPSDNAVRISLDTNLCMIREIYQPENGQWCRSVTDELSPDDLERFPYAILEIKLQSEAPPWIAGLLNLGEIREVHKFSKFLHGMATFYPHKTRIEPQWLQYMQSARREVRRLVPMGIGQTAPMLDPNEDTPMLARAAHSAAPVTTRASPSFPNRPAQKATPRLRTRHPSGARAPVGSTRPAPKPAAPAVPKRIGKQVRVEPKTFFANERTLLQWLNTVVLLGLACISLISLGKDNIVAFSAGIMLATVAILFAFYSLYTYQKRLNAMMSGEAIRYDDRLGPPILVVSLVIVLGVSVVFGLASRDAPLG